MIHLTQELAFYEFSLLFFRYAILSTVVDKDSGYTQS